MTFVKSIRTIYVIWFNERNNPARIIEVEHTTKFKDSLIRFSQLQDFNTKMTIVADKDRQDKYDKILSLEAFKPISKRVEFKSYEEVESVYSSTKKSFKF